jgi:FkbM family methyltransferase
VIVDAGANIGAASIYFTHKYPEARIIAIEPEASIYPMLTRNVRPYPAIIPVQAALWSRDGEIGIGEADPTSGVSGNWAFGTGDRPGVKVKAMTMPTLMKEMNIQAIDLVKIDIEGAELEVFKDFGWLRTVRCLMIELHDRFRPGCSDAVNPVMQGFSKSMRGETTFFVRK